MAGVEENFILDRDYGGGGGIGLFLKLLNNCWMALGGWFMIISGGRLGN